VVLPRDDGDVPAAAAGSVRIQDRGDKRDFSPNLGEMLPDLADDAQARAEQRLHEQTIVWLTTVTAGGQPQTSPVGYVWDRATFVIISRPAAPKVRNLRTNPRVSLHLDLDSNAESYSVLTIEGVAALDSGTPRCARPAERRRGLGLPGQAPEGDALGGSDARADLHRLLHRDPGDTRTGPLPLRIASHPTGHGGIADPQEAQPWQRDTLQAVYSTTKGATSACALLLVQRGELDLDAPVRDYWPEFTAPVEVRRLLAHQAVLPALDRPVPLADAPAWDPMVEALAAQQPVWTPGTEHGYHGLTFGWLVGEVVRRVSGRSLGTFFREEIAEPRNLDFWSACPNPSTTGRAGSSCPSPIPTPWPDSTSTNCPSNCGTCSPPTPTRPR
jgi:PPOX class probable F420-dependent enzyme